jgi:hypothetical protein
VPGIRRRPGGACGVMARPPARFRQDDVTRALRGAEAAGRKPRRFRVEPDGAIDVVLEEMGAPDPSPEPEQTPPSEIEL